MTPSGTTASSTGTPGRKVMLRKPKVGDVPSMVALMSPHVMSERLLPRTSRQVAERLRDYVVAEHSGDIIGLASVTLVDLHLAEVGALVAADEAVETRLIDAVLCEAAEMGVSRAFVLTDALEPWQRRGFAPTTVSRIPEKRDRQCLRCPRLPRCRQVALEIELGAPLAAR